MATKLSSVHFGHVGQPSPEPVSRTAPPVTTMTPLAIALTSATRETTAEEKGGEGRHAPMLGRGQRAGADLPRRRHSGLIVMLVRWAPCRYSGRLYQVSRP